MVTVDANALRQVLQALTGPAHLIREIQMTRSVAALTGDDPIGLLIDDYNHDVERQADEAGVEAAPASLTDEQIMEVWNSRGPWSNDEMDPVAFARAVLAATGVKTSEGVKR